MSGIGDITFSLARAEDDDGIRSLLRRSSMEGAVSLTFQRDPSYFLEADFPSQVQQTVVAKQGRRVVCVGQGSVRRLYWNSQPRPIGYLGGLRLDPEYAGRYDILCRGYEFFRNLSWPETPDLFFTSVMLGNERARQFLEGSLRGMPRYRNMADFVTVLIPVPRTVSWEDESPAENDPGELAEWLNQNNASYQLGQYWTAESLLGLGKYGLEMKDFLVQRTDHGISACAALWDQRSFKQTVIQSYDWRLAALRPLLNLVSRCGGRPGLPAAGSVLAHGFLSHISVGSEQPGLIRGLIKGMFPRARRAGLDYLTMGFTEGDRRLTVVRRSFSHREYRSKLYHVTWDGRPLPGAVEKVKSSGLGFLACPPEGKWVFSPEAAFL